MKPVARILICMVIVFALDNFPMDFHQSKNANPNITDTAKDVDSDQVNGPLNLTVKLEKRYLDGEISEEIVNETIWSMEDFWESHADWQLVQQDDQQIVFKKNFNDISPLSKANGYFGITSDGTLTIFEGKPTKSSKVIQSFYQIDLDKLEISEHQLLKNGIPVQSRNHFESVIQTFKPYSYTIEK